MSISFSNQAPCPLPAATAASIAQAIIPVAVDDGARFELLCVQPVGAWRQLLYWLPAMGIPARHYLPLAEALAAHGVAVVVHEWRGIGSSNRRAGHRDDWGYRELLAHDLPAALAVVRTRWPQAACWLGGHSLGGQLGSLYASLHPSEHAGLVLVASGSPYWRRFRFGGLIGMAYVLAPWLAALVGYLPGRRIGFAGNEARGVIADWARSGRTGRYAAAGMAQDFEQALAALSLPTLALRLHDDWLGPQASLDWLFDKMPRASRRVEVITSHDLDDRPADHFGWMKTPQPIAARIAGWIATQEAVPSARTHPAA
ncbi:alpha/beta fold hydrolase [Rhodanobacter sp. C03]|uniref:alpha/beta hydrolase family protein n=1 Tax=Rhodanobacter sp. C03 TaxID=1945858 RepID=UPI000984DB5A|nr:alpha/beta fold hydrolase [Rhodanobacter sp. C03]OOG58388.1 alpha/beta hydrolase [Rhodanobacter sp. C03]